MVNGGREKEGVKVGREREREERETEARDKMESRVKERRD